MTQELAIFLGVLAAWRLAQDYVNEEGPFGLYGQMRRWLKSWAAAQIEASDVNNPYDHELYWLYDGVECVVCVSLWTALLVATLIRQAHQPRRGGLVSELAELLLCWLGLAGGALVVERVYQWLKSGVPLPLLPHQFAPNGGYPLGADSAQSATAGEQGNGVEYGPE